MERDLTIDEAARTFIQVVQRVRGGENTHLVEDGKVVAHIIPATRSSPYTTAEDVARWWKDPARARLTPEEAEAFEADLEAARKFLLPPKDNLWE